MEKRNIRMYSIQPSLSNFGLHAKDPHHFAREVAVLAVAIASEKSVVIKPEYRVYLHGTVEVAPSNRDFRAGETINTSHITEIYFEKVHIKGKIRTDLYIKTKNTTYLIRDYKHRMRPSFRQLLYRAIRSDGMTFDSCAGYFSKVEDTTSEIEVVS